MDFPKLLRQKQFELGMTVTAFAKHIGKSRQFLTLIYSNSPRLKKYRLSELTMYDLEQRFNIPKDVMEKYNEEVENHNGRIEKSASR